MFTNTRPQGAASVSPNWRSRTPRGVQVVLGGRTSEGCRFARLPAHFCSPSRGMFLRKVCPIPASGLPLSIGTNRLENPFDGRRPQPGVRRHPPTSHAVCGDVQSTSPGFRTVPRRRRVRHPDRGYRNEPGVERSEHPRPAAERGERRDFGRRPAATLRRLGGGAGPGLRRHPPSPLRSAAASNRKARAPARHGDAVASVDPDRGHRN
jgi:hypothetical protein